DDRAGNEERLDSHVVESSDRARGVVRVQRAEDLVTGECGFHRDVRGFVIANFTDHHNVGVLAQNRSKRGSEIEPDIRTGCDLVYTHQLVLNRVLDGDDVVIWTVEFLENGIERGRLS